MTTRNVLIPPFYAPGGTDLISVEIWFELIDSSQVSTDAYRVSDDQGIAYRTILVTDNTTQTIALTTQDDIQDASFWRVTVFNAPAAGLPLSACAGRRALHANAYAISLPPGADIVFREFLALQEPVSPGALISWQEHAADNTRHLPTDATAGQTIAWDDTNGRWIAVDFPQGGNISPIANAGGPYTPTVNVQFSADGAASSDPDGTITQYDWDWGDGNTSPDAGATPLHTYTTTVGSPFTVELTVTDNDGATDAATTTATVSAANQPPVADAGGPYVTNITTETTVDGTGSSDSDGTIARYDWDMGDGTTYDDVGSTQAHTYAALGQYTVTLTVTDNDGATDIDATTADIVDPANAIVAENALAGAGTRSDWETVAAPTSIEGMGYTDKSSYNVGETVNFRVHNPAADITEIKIYRAGYYAGDNARLIATIVNTPTTQGNETTIVDSQGATDCTGWSNTASWTIPTDAVSGVYLAAIKNAGLTIFQRVEFVVRDDFALADIAIVRADNTHAAYNAFGGPSVGWDQGKSLYGQGPGNFNTIDGRSFAVSLHRPNVNRGTIINSTENYDLNAVDGMERLGYNVKYVSDVDLDSNPLAIEHCKAIMFMGHNEYWSQNMVDNVLTARNSGKHLVVASGNTVFWRVRFDDTDSHIIWCYKDTTAFSPLGYDPVSASSSLDPVSPRWTGTWSYSKRLDVLTGGEYTPMRGSIVTKQFFRMNAIGAPYKDITVLTADHATSPVWRNTLVTTEDRVLDGMIGFEADEPENPGDGSIFTVHGSSLVTDISYYDDDGVSAGIGSFTAAIAVSQSASAHGATVSFSAMNALWLVSDYHQLGNAIQDDEFAQAFVNILNDLGVQPVTPDVGLIVDAPQPLTAYGIDWASNQPPVAEANGPYADNTDQPITFSSAGSYDPEGAPLSYEWDFGDGSPTSTDANPVYAYPVADVYTVTLTVTDNQTLTGQDTATATITENAEPEVNILGDVTPANQDSGTSIEYTFGTEFFADFKGYVRGIRFWAPATASPQTVRLFEDNLDSTGVGTGTGRLLASKAVSGFVGGAWHEERFDTPIAILANTRYVVAYHIGAAPYAFEIGYLNSQVDNPPVHAYADNNAGNQGNGTFVTGDNFPNNWAGDGRCYFADVIFQRDDTVNVLPIAEANGPYTEEETVLISFSSAGSSDPDGTIATYAWDFGDGTGTSAEANPSYAYSTAGGYTATLTVTDDGGATAQDTAAVTITAPGGGGVQPINEGQTPEQTDVTDAGSDYQLGMRLKNSNAIVIDKIHFFTADSETSTGMLAYISQGSSPYSLLSPTLSIAGSTPSQYNEAVFTNPFVCTADELIVVSRGINTHFPVGPDLPISKAGFTEIARALHSTPGNPPNDFTSQANYHVDITYSTVPSLAVHPSSQLDVPVSTDISDLTDYQMGLRITPNSPGQITEVWYWNPDTGGTAARAVKIWDAASPGAPVVDTTIAPDTQKRWSRLVLGTPVSCTAGQTYVVTVATGNQRYSDGGTIPANGAFSLLESTFSTDLVSMPTNNSTTDYGVDIRYE